MSPLFNIVLAVLWGFSLAGFAWCCMKAAQSISYVTLADGQRTERRLPIIIRLLLPLTPNLTPHLVAPSLEPMK
ncbi:MAG: hypothetical protein WCP86_02885, partial [bacterium]